MGFPYDRSNDPKANINWGRDFNFFQKLTVTSSVFTTDCDMVITFPTCSVTFQLEGTGTIQYSFNGHTVHGDMGNGLNSANLTFDNRVISKIWFKTLSGTPTVRVEAWGIR